MTTSIPPRDIGNIVHSNDNVSNHDFKHTYTKVDGITLHHVHCGEGSPVLLLPGWPQTWYVWRHVMRALAKVGYRAIAVDLRGLGQSSRPTTGYDTGRVAADLHHLMRKLGHEHYPVIGHDVGMWIGYALASDHPEVVERLAILEAFIPGLARSPEIFLPQSQNVFMWHFMFNQLADLPELLIQGRERAYLSWMFDQWAYKRDRVAVETYIESYSSPGALRGGFAHYRAIPETSAQNERRAKTKLRMPVLALGAEHATADMPLTIMEPVANDLRGAILPGCGHFVPEEDPDALLAHVLPFLRGAS
ncbi:alpha/beta fold hydrolase [Pendulispora albinea]|uniref:Alpha/beta hydrolase n=1 Tax=Pendulispora albinea TaxID=2741071 RepID=A0ABZ2LZ23_9BACT